MREVTVRIPTPLRTFTAGADEVVVSAETVGQALEALGQKHEGILDHLLDSEGALRRFVNVYIGDRNISAVGGFEAALEDNTIISIVPAVAGGWR